MRYKIIFSYNGKGYFGYQEQVNKLTIAKVLNDTLTDILGEPVKVTPSGRTDTDVSAIAQVGHFDFDGVLPANFVGYVNSKLPASIKLASCEKAPNFHARYDAKIKTYEYKFYVSFEPNAYFDTFAYHVKKCNVDKMVECLKYLVGTHDFSTFQASGSAVKDKVRTIYDAKIVADGNLYTFSITGNGFLYNMVRIIVGTLINVGTKNLPDNYMQMVIESKNRKEAGPTVPAYPLVLKSVEY